VDPDPARVTRLACSSADEVVRCGRCHRYCVSDDSWCCSVLGYLAPLQQSCRAMAPRCGYCGSDNGPQGIHSVRVCRKRDFVCRYSLPNGNLFSMRGVCRNPEHSNIKCSACHEDRHNFNSQVPRIGRWQFGASGELRRAIRQRKLADDDFACRYRILLPGDGPAGAAA